MNCTPQISYPYTLQEITYIGQRMAESECLDELTDQGITDDTVVRDLVAAFYRRHRRACITISRFMCRPVAHDLFLSSLPF